MSRKICGCSRELISLLFNFNRRLTSSCKCTQTYFKQVPLADKQMLIFPPLQVNTVFFLPGVSSAAWLVLVILSKQCGGHHRPLVTFIQLFNKYWASPMLSTAFVSGHTVVNNFLPLWQFYWTKSSSFSIMLESKFRSPMPYDKQWCLKFPL